MTITINGTTGITGVDGSATTPAFQGNDTNTGLFYGTDIVAVSTGGSERMRVDASGNVGIGTTSPVNLSGQKSVTINATGVARTDYQISGTTQGYTLVESGYLGVYTPSTQFLSLGTNNTERMRIDSSGNVLVNTTGTTPTASNASVIYGGADAGIIYMWRASGTSDVFRFYNAANKVGNITTTASATTYNSGSDYRLKDNIIPMIGALEKVMQLNPVTFNWKVDGSDGQGFIAHELQSIIPSAVTGEKDAMDKEGKPDYQSVDPRMIVATLTKAIQELKAIVDAQQQEINELKANNV